MCGLVGIASNNLIVGDRNVFTSLLYLDELRGEHSTGVAAVDKAGDVSVYKRALKASDFIQLKGYTNTLLKADKVLMGHNRYATMGARDDNNAHPFTHGTITLMHNGTLNNKLDVNSCKAVFNTDSETIAYALSREDTKEVLERLGGAYALVWYDEEELTLNFARNDERPLFLGRIGANDLVWASEKAMLELVAEHHKKTLKDVFMLATGKVVSFDVANLSAEPEILEFTPKPKPVIQSYGNNYGQGSASHVTRRPRTYYNNFSRSVEATLTECRQSGFFIAVTDDGSHVQGNVSQQDAVALIVAASAGKRIKGKVASTTDRWLAGKWQEVFYLQGDSVEVIKEEEEVADSGTEKKCQLCLSSSTIGWNGTPDEMEYHRGRYYHTSCLDNEHHFTGNFYS